MKHPSIETLNKLSGFTNHELYILKRQCVISSYEIIMGGMFTPEEIDIHNKIMNEIISEIRRRRSENNW